MGRHTGAFVYTGSGKKQADDASDSQKQCKQLACNIQWCLARRGHIEARCKDFIEAWDKCVKEADAAQALREKTEQN